METLSPELKQAVAQSGGSPVRLVDPDTQRTYVLVSAETYDRMVLEEDEKPEQASFLRIAKRNAKARLMEDE